MPDDATGAESSTTQTITQSAAFLSVIGPPPNAESVVGKEWVQNWNDNLLKLKKYDADTSMHYSPYYDLLRGLVAKLAELNNDLWSVWLNSEGRKWADKAELADTLKEPVVGTLNVMNGTMSKHERWPSMRQLQTETLAQGSLGGGMLSTIPEELLNKIAALAGDPRAVGVTSCVAKRATRPGRVGEEPSSRQLFAGTTGNKVSGTRATAGIVVDSRDGLEKGEAEDVRPPSGCVLACTAAMFPDVQPDEDETDRQTIVEAELLTRVTNNGWA